MSVDGRNELQRFAESVVEAFLQQVKDSEHADQAEASREFFASRQCADLVDRFMRSFAQALATDLMQERRADPFRRLLCHPLTELLDQGALSRSLLGNYFSFLHLVLGDDQESMTQRCQQIIDQLHSHPQFSWDLFYDNERAKLVLWQALMRVQDTFKRFDARRDWFIGLMQNRPHSVSLGTHSFMTLPRSDEEDQASFGVTEFNLMFGALYRPLLSLNGADQAAFSTTFGAPPEKWIRPLVDQLG
jgi:hypothetical protein